MSAVHPDDTCYRSSRLSNLRTRGIARDSCKRTPHYTNDYTRPSLISCPIHSEVYLSNGLSNSRARQESYIPLMFGRRPVQSHRRTIPIGRVSHLNGSEAYFLREVQLGRGLRGLQGTFCWLPSLFSPRSTYLAWGVLRRLTCNHPRVDQSHAADSSVHVSISWA